MTDNNDYDLRTEIEGMYEEYKAHTNYTVDALIDNILNAVETSQQKQYKRGLADGATLNQDGFQLLMKEQYYKGIKAMAIVKKGHIADRIIQQERQRIKQTASEKSFIAGEMRVIDLIRLNKIIKGKT